MRKIKRPKIGQYVLVTRWSDKDPLDPWYVGFVNEIIIREKEIACKVSGSACEWKHIWSITEQEGNMLLVMSENDKKNFCPGCNNVSTWKDDGEIRTCTKCGMRVRKAAQQSVQATDDNVMPPGGYSSSELAQRAKYG